MTRDAQSLKIEKWATAGERETPEENGIDRSEGWDITYEQLGGNKPERKVFNQIMRELTGLAVDMTNGGVLEWNSGVDYIHTAFVRGSNGRLYRSLVSSGPESGNATDPTASPNTIWRLY